MLGQPFSLMDRTWPHRRAVPMIGTGEGSRTKIYDFLNFQQFLFSGGAAAAEEALWLVGGGGSDVTRRVFRRGPDERSIQFVRILPRIPLEILQ